MEKGENYPNLVGHYERASVCHWTHSSKGETPFLHTFVRMRARMKAVTRTSLCYSALLRFEFLVTVNSVLYLHQYRVRLRADEHSRILDKIYVVCLKSKCIDFLFKCLLDSPEITSYPLQSMALGKLHNGSNVFSTDHSSTGVISVSVCSSSVTTFCAFSIVPK